MKIYITYKTLNVNFSYIIWLRLKFMVCHYKFYQIENWPDYRHFMVNNCLQCVHRLSYSFINGMEVNKKILNPLSPRVLDLGSLWQCWIPYRIRGPLLTMKKKNFKKILKHYWFTAFFCSQCEKWNFLKFSFFNFKPLYLGQILTGWALVFLQTSTFF